MPFTLARDAIVDALDDLGEREQLSSAWLNADEEQPYPPEAVRQRSRRLRWRLQWWRRTFMVLMLLVAVTGGLGIAGWTIPGFLFGSLFGFGGAFVVVSLFKSPWTEPRVRALQLYDLLKQIDTTSESAAEN